MEIADRNNDGIIPRELRRQTGMPFNQFVFAIQSGGLVRGDGIGQLAPFNHIKRVPGQFAGKGDFLRASRQPVGEGFSPGFFHGRTLRLQIGNFLLQRAQLLLR